MKIKITKEIMIAVVNVVSAVVCATLAGCRLAVGNLEVEFASDIGTNMVERITK